MKVRITECLDIDLESETWCCNRCDHSIWNARDNYKKGCLIAERDPDEIYPPELKGEEYGFRPDPEYCRLIEFYCPECSVLIESENLPPGHPLTHEVEIDIDALKRRHGR